MVAFDVVLYADLDVDVMPSHTLAAPHWTSKVSIRTYIHTYIHRDVMRLTGPPR